MVRRALAAGRWRGAAAVLLAAALVAGCSRVGPTARAAPSPSSTGGAAPPAGRAVDPATSVDGSPSTTPATAARDRRPEFDDLGVDDAVDAVLADLDDFWGDELLARFGSSYEPPARPRGVRPDADPPLRCGQKPVAPSAITRNALYCPADDYVAWDATFLPDLAASAGPFSVALVIAHEWGHVIQDRTAWPHDPVTVELQADCYAGAWAAHAARDESRRFRLAPGDLDSALAGFLRLQDGGDPGARPVPDRHGTAFDRVSAFADGHHRGTAGCATYGTQPPALVSLPVTPEDLAGQRLPIDQLVAMSLNDLDAFWGATFAARGLRWNPLADPLAVVPQAPAHVTCAGQAMPPDVVERGAWLCLAEGHVGVAVAGLADVARSLGDFAAVLVLSVPWAEAAAARLGGGDPDCLAGAWAGAPSPGAEDQVAQPLSLSGSDLDEAVAGLLATSAGGAGPGGRTAFDRVEGFRQGYVDGVAGCLSTR